MLLQTTVASKTISLLKTHDSERKTQCNKAVARNYAAV